MFFILRLPRIAIVVVESVFSLSIRRKRAGSAPQVHPKPLKTLPIFECDATGPIDMNEWLRRPPGYALAVSLFMLAFGTLVGAMLVSFQDSFYAAARREIIKRPEIHGFAGSEAIDQGRIAEVADQANAALRLLHTHSLGIGILILLATLAIVNLPISRRLQTLFCVLVSVGAVYPFGWAVLTWLIPVMGVEALRAPVEWIFFVPFGGALMIGLIGAVGVSVADWLRLLPKTTGAPR
jgi:hypothetical protein